MWIEPSRGVSVVDCQSPHFRAKLRARSIRHELRKLEEPVTSPARGDRLGGWTFTGRPAKLSWLSWQRGKTFTALLRRFGSDGRFSLEHLLNAVLTSRILRRSCSNSPASNATPGEGLGRRSAHGRRHGLVSGLSSPAYLSTRKRQCPSGQLNRVFGPAHLQ